MAHRQLTGVLLVGGASRRFGSPKALARVGDETLAEHGWRILGEVCDERIAVGKAAELDLPFALVDDGTDVRAPIVGVVAALRAATHDVCVLLPVDCILVPSSLLVELGTACRDAAVTQVGPLPGAWSKSALPVLEHRLAGDDLSLKGAYNQLELTELHVPAALVADADTPEELARLVAAHSSATTTV